MINLHQLDWVLNHLGHLTLDLGMRVILLVSFNWGQRTYLEYGQCSPMGWSPGVKEKEQREKSYRMVTFISLLPDYRRIETSHPMLLLPSLPQHDRLYPQTVGQSTPPALRCSCRVFFSIATRNVTNAWTIIVL